MSTNWSPSPPTEPGWYWVLFDGMYEEVVMLGPAGAFWACGSSVAIDLKSPAYRGMLFGSRIPSAAELTNRQAEKGNP